MEILHTSIQGIYRDILQGKAHTIIYDSGWHSNLIVDRCRYLLAAFMKNDTATGIQWLAVGKGIQSWDNQAPAYPLPIDYQLTDPDFATIEIDPARIEYLNADGDPTTDPTHRIQVTITLDPGVPALEAGATTYPLREFGLFGTFGAGNEEYMIDYVRHPVIHKGAEDTLVRTIRLIF